MGCKAALDADDYLETAELQVESGAAEAAAGDD